MTATPTNDGTGTGQATPHGVLIEQIMDSRVAKSEREWAASRELQKYGDAHARWTREASEAIAQRDAARAHIARLTAEVGRLGSLLGCDSGHECLRCKTHIYGMFISSGSEGKFYCPICWERVQCESALSQLSACERARDEARGRVGELAAIRGTNDGEITILTAKLRKAEDALREIHNEAPDGVARMALAALTSLRTPPSEGRDPNRCAFCGWPLADEVSKGCVRGNCSQRPIPTNLYDPVRAASETKPTAPCRTCGGTKKVWLVDASGIGYAKPCPTCCPASEPAPPPTPPAFKARRWVDADVPPLPGYWESKPDGSIWYHEGRGRDPVPTTFERPEFEDPELFTEVPIPTPKEEVCDSGSGSSVGVEGTIPKARTGETPTPPTNPSAVPAASDPPATRDAGEGPYRVEENAHGWKYVKLPDGEMVWDNAPAWVPRLNAAYAAGCASVSPAKYEPIPGGAEDDGEGVISHRYFDKPPAPHAEFVAAAVKVLNDRLHKLRGGQRCGCWLCDDIRKALALAPAQEGM